MRDDAARTGLDKALDVTPDDVVAMQNTKRPKKKPTTFEDDPNFSAFLDFLRQDALRHPDQLGDVGELLDVPKKPRPKKKRKKQ